LHIAHLDETDASGQKLIKKLYLKSLPFNQFFFSDENNFVAGVLFLK
jgi:hypothetical protein